VFPTSCSTPLHAQTEACTYGAALAVGMGIAQKLWAGLWYTRAQCLQKEQELLDNLLRNTGFGWTGRDTLVSAVKTAGTDPADVVRSVSVNESHAGRVDLVCVHGFGQSGAGCFYAALAGWASLGRVHLVDWRGAGMSGRPAGPFAPSNETEAIEYLVDGLDAWRRERLGETARICLIGHSMGAIVAAHYALRHPEHVRHLILAGPAAVREADPKKVQAFLDKAGPARRALYQFFAKRWEEGWTPQMVLRSFPFYVPRQLIKGYVRNRWRAEETLDPETFSALYEYNVGFNMLPGVSERVLNLILKPIGQARTPISITLKQLPETVPLTFVYGEYDWMTPSSGVSVTEEMRRAGRTNVECHVLPDAGHYPFIDQPEMVLEIVKRAWERCDQR